MHKHAAAAHKARKMLVKEYGALHGALTKLFHQADPIGIGPGMPADEYESEVGTVLPRLKRCTGPDDVQTVLHEEFSHWFNHGLAGPASTYRPLALDVWKLLQERPRDA